MIASAAVVLTALADGSSTRTFRTTAVVGAVLQVPNPVATNTALLVPETFAGHDFVSWALGTTNVLANMELALEINCDSSQASLVVFDSSSSNNIATIATSTQINVLTGQNNPTAAGPNHERFVMQMDINPNNYIVGGFLTIAGRVFLNPSNGCPQAVLVDTDHEYDSLFEDAYVKNLDNKSEKDKDITGLAHLIGVANVLFENGSTNTVLLPFGQLTMRRQLLP